MAVLIPNMRIPMDCISCPLNEFGECPLLDAEQRKERKEEMSRISLFDNEAYKYAKCPLEEASERTEVNECRDKENL